MSTLVNWNGQQYLVPAYNDTGYAQGNGNLSQYLVAISTGSLQQVGGLFQLTADADFGPNFGLVSSYFKSRSANIASAGVLRLANTDAIKWRNSDNSADVTLAMNATGTAARTYTIPDIASSDFVMTEGAQTVNGAKTFGSAIIGSLTGAASLNLLLTGGTMTGSIAFGGSYKLTGLAAGSTNGDSVRYEQVLLLSGGTMAGNIAMSGTQKLTGLAAGSGNGDSLRYEQLVGAYLPLSGGTLTGQLLVPNGTSGAPSYAFSAHTDSGLYYATTTMGIVFGGAIQLQVGSGFATCPNGPFRLSDGTVGAPALTWINDLNTGAYSGGDGIVNLGSNGTLCASFSGSGCSLKGTTTNDSASAGNIGQYIESVVGSTANPATDVWGDLTSISLTAGDWDVSALKYTLTGSSMTKVSMGISTTSGDSATGLVVGSTWFDELQTFVVGGTCCQSIPNWRVSIASTTTIYLKFRVTTTGSVFTSYGRLSARRMR